MLDEQEVRKILARAKKEHKSGSYEAFYQGFEAGLEVVLEESNVPWTESPKPAHAHRKVKVKSVVEGAGVSKRDREGY